MKIKLYHKKSCKKSIVWSILVLVAIACCGVSYAETTVTTSLQQQVNEKRVTISRQNVPVKQILDEIKKQTGINFMLDADALRELGNRTLQVTDTPVNTALNKLLEGSSYTYRLGTNSITIVKKNTPKKQTQNKPEEIQGIITDQSGTPIYGATVVIKGTTQGTASEIDGNFSLKVESGDILQFSFVGMKTQEITYSGQLSLAIKMENEISIVDNVVVIGYGTKSKENITSSVASVSSEELQRFSNGTSTFDNMLGGAVKGMLVQQSSGKPGSASTINVRGITSPVSGSTNEPLYVIDGVPFFAGKGADDINPLMGISPSDIKSIDVLKDAAATSIYGSRGANGVIIVNTFTGNKNQRTKVFADYTLSIGSPVKRYRPLNTAEYKSMHDLILRNTTNAINNGELNIGDYLFAPGFGDVSFTGIGGMGTQWSFDEYGMPSGVSYSKLNDEAFGKYDTNWVKEAENSNAVSHQYNAGLRGGSKSTNYSFSFNAIDQQGLYINDELKRYGGRLSIDSDVSERIKAGATLNYAYMKRNLGNDLSFMGATKEWSFAPDVPVKNADGSWGTAEGAYSYGMPSALANPVAARQKRNQNRTSQFNGSAYLEYSILPNLTLRGDVNLSKIDYHNSMFYPTYSIDNMNVMFGGYPDATLTDDYSSSFNSSINAQINYSLHREKHNLDLMAGYSWDRTTDESSSNNYAGFPDDEVLTNISSAARSESYSGNKIETGLNSVFARASYSFDDKYLLEVNFRSDASSKFGPGNKRAYFPAFSLGWKINHERFMESVRWVNGLKLRVSVGQTGSTNIGNFIYRQFFSRGSSVLYEGKPGITPGGESSNAFPNFNVKWEMTTEYNLGIDFELLDYRLFGSIDLYHRYTKGALSPSPFPYETGAKEFYSNLMDMSNRGVEFEVGGHIIHTENFKWTSRFNVSLNRNRVEKLNGANLNPYQIDSYQEGEAAGILKGYIVEKIFSSNDEVAELNRLAHKANPDVEYYQSASTARGDFKFKDLNGDGRITSADRTIIATPEPKFFGGFINTLNYKNLTLSAVLQFSHGTKSYINQMTTDTYALLGRNMNRYLYENSWREDKTDTRFARLVNLDPSYNSRMSDRYVFKTSYLRLKNITVSYNVPRRFLDRINIQSLQVFAGATNLWTLTSWPGLDPELLDSTRGFAGYTNNDDPYPLSKTFTLGVKIEF